MYGVYNDFLSTNRYLCGDLQHFAPDGETVITGEFKCFEVGQNDIATVVKFYFAHPQLRTKDRRP